VWVNVENMKVQSHIVEKRQGEIVDSMFVLLC
jgi:hypothetical protein